MTVEKIIDRLSKLSLKEVESEELCQPVASSYAELIEQIANELKKVQQLNEDLLKIIRNAIAVLIQRRISKILQKIVVSEEISRKMLYREEKKIVDLFSKLTLEKLKEAERPVEEVKEEKAEASVREVEHPEVKEVREVEVREIKEKEEIVTERETPIPEDVAIVVFKEDFPAIHSVAMMTLGPFQKFDIVAIPTDDAEELKRKNVIDIIQLVYIH